MKIDVNRLELAMRYRGLSNKEAASAAGIQATLLSRIKARGSCSPATGRKLAQALGSDIIIHPGFEPSADAEAVWHEYLSQIKSLQLPPEDDVQPLELRVYAFVQARILPHWERLNIYQRRVFWLDKESFDASYAVERVKVCPAEIWCELLQRDLDEMSNKDATHINKFYLSHTFSKYLGMSPITYLIQRRLQISKDLLTQTDYSIAEIAASTGFASQSYFSQIFKKFTGISPNQYRKQNAVHQ